MPSRIRYNRISTGLAETPESALRGAMTAHQCRRPADTTADCAGTRQRPHRPTSDAKARTPRRASGDRPLNRRAIMPPHAPVGPVLPGTGYAIDSGARFSAVMPQTSSLRSGTGGELPSRRRGRRRRCKGDRRHRLVLNTQASQSGRHLTPVSVKQKQACGARDAYLIKHALGQSFTGPPRRHRLT